MKDADQHLERLRSLQAELEAKSADFVTGRMTVEAGALAVCLVKILDKTHRRILILTWALFGLTVALLIVAVAEVVHGFLR